MYYQITMYLKYVVKYMQTPQGMEKNGFDITLILVGLERFLVNLANFFATIGVDSLVFW